MRIKTITIKNFFAIQSAVINVGEFLDNNGILITGINYDDEGADNSGAGKSSLIQSIGWAIFGEVAKDISVDKIIRFGTNQALVKIEFDDNSYIERKRGKKNSLEFVYKGEDLTERTRSMTQEKIFQKFNMKGTPKQCYMDFLNTVFLSSSTVETFSSSKFTSSDRFNFISRIMSLDVWKDASKISKEKENKIQDDLDKVRLKLETEKEYFVDITEEGLIVEKRFLEDQVIIYAKKMENKREKIQEVEKENEAGDGLLDKVILLQSNLVNLKTTVDIKKENYDSKLTKFEELLEKETETIKSLKEIENSKDSWTTPDSVKRITEKIDTLKKEKDKTQEIFTKVTHDLMNSLEENTKLKDQIKNHIQCPHCNNDVLIINGKLSKHDEEKIAKESNSYMQKLATLEYDEHRLNDELEQKRNKIEEGASILEKAKQVEQERKNFMIIIDDIDPKAKDNYVDLHEEFGRYESESNNEIKTLEKSIELAKKEKDEFVETSTDELKIELEGYIFQKDEFTTKLGACNKTLESFLEHEKKVKSLENNEKAFKNDIISSKFWSKGFIDIRRMIIESSLPRLESLINSHLESLLMPLRVQIDTLREIGDKGKLKEEFNILVKNLTTDHIDVIDTYSDGQKKRIGIAICFALNDFLKDKQYPFNFLLIDQLLGGDIDDIGVDLIMNIFNASDSQKFFISHNEKLKDKLTSKIWVEMRAGVTTIK